MKAAFHFSADAYGGVYGPPVLQLFFETILGCDSGSLDSPVRIGDLLIHRLALQPGSPTEDAKGRPVQPYYHHEELAIQAREAILGESLPNWRSIPREPFERAMKESRIFVVLLEETPFSLVECVDERLHTEAGYLGAIEVYSPEPAHWSLYDQRLLLRYRIAGRTLSLMHREFEGEDGRPHIEEWMKAVQFDAIEYEDIGVKDTIFDPEQIRAEPPKDVL